MIDLPALKGLLDKARDIRKKKERVDIFHFSPQNYFALTSLNNELSLIDSQLRNALVGSASELIRLAEIGKRAEDTGEPIPYSVSKGPE